ncbi:uncharacterized protein N7511_002306 [Penicillium nucicola]|uniref:uncharacterized protein n=1 Tax=Penicillium nucicola TaxID=1850975 RepID=UPI00254500AB|nr:uncharacterized protein N7511_002306 [Penicillium nucicola]KAJ5770255.1 hypothetical protein N7511_002306 [Penicillium nucicola]
MLGRPYTSSVLALLLAALGSATGATAKIATKACTSATFEGLTLPDIKILSIDSVVAQTAWPSSSDLVNAFPSTKAGTVDVCQLTITYAHVGQNDTINTWVWLPINSWNGRFVGMGGSGWVTGTASSLAQPVFEGYSAASTDGGHSAAASVDSWALEGGDLNWLLIEDFSSTTLDEASSLGKAASKLFYGSLPKYSYFNGCSTGGRQGHMLAQKFPAQYDGILAGSPAINWDEFIPAQYWPPLLMHKMDYYPSPCELDAITNFAIKSCDKLDGVEDGIVSLPGLCRFDPFTLVGKKISCTNPNGTITLSNKSAQFAAAVWAGPTDSDGSSLWYGLTHDAPLTGIGGTSCSSLHDCVPAPFFLSTDWLATFLSKNAARDISTISLEEFRQLFHTSVTEFQTVIGTRDPNLSAFKQSGNKMITWHGMKDPYAMYNGTVDYYDRVRAVDPKVADYYRFFAAPGVEHCSGGPGPFPGDGLKALVNWVEHGKAPDTLLALATPTATGSADLSTRTARLCPYPHVLTYSKGNPDKASSYTCK